MTGGPQVFIAHAGEQKRGFVDMLRVLLRDTHALNVFVDEWSLQPNDDALPVIKQNLRTAAVVAVVLSHDFVAKEYPMDEVREIVQMREAGSSQRVCIVLHGITYEQCSERVLPEYAADLTKLLGITAVRDDQARERPVALTTCCLGAFSRWTWLLRRLQGAWRLATEGSWQQLLLWLRKSQQVLIVLENAEHALCDQPSAKALLQLLSELHTCPRVSMVITSRIKPDTQRPMLHLPPLDPDSAVDLLLQHSAAKADALQSQRASRLVRLCGCNALLLQILGAMIKSGRCELEDVLKAAQSGGPLSVLQDSQQGGVRENECIGRALDWIAGRLRPAQLQALSSLSLFKGSFSKEAAIAVLQPGATAPATVLQDLEDACLLVRTSSTTAKTPRFSLHPVVWDAAARQRHTQPQPQQLAALEAFLSCMLACGERLEGMQPGVGSTAEVVEAAQLLTDEAPNVVSLAAQLCQLPLCASAASEHTDTLDGLDILAGLLAASGHYATAGELLQPVVAARERTQGPAHLDTLQTAAALADLLGEIGRNAEAEQRHQRLLRLAEAEFGREHTATLDIMDRIGIQLHRQGRFVEAEAQQRLTYDLRHRVQGAEHPDTLESLLSLASAVDELGRCAESLDLLSHALKAQQTVLGPQHPSTLTSMCIVAEMLGKLGRHDDMAEQLDETIWLLQRVVGPANPVTVLANALMALALSKLGQHTEADAPLQQVLEAQRQVAGHEDRQTLYAMHIAACVVGEQGEHEKAAAHFRAVIDRSSCLLGPEHPYTLSSKYELARQVWELGDHGAALDQHWDVLMLRRSVLGMQHPATLGSLQQYAEGMGQQERHNIAVVLHERELRERQALLGSMHPETLRSMDDLAAQLYGLLAVEPDAAQQYQEALQVMSPAFEDDQADGGIDGVDGLAAQLAVLGWQAEAAEQHLPYMTQSAVETEHSDALNCLGRLAEQYEGVGRYAEAAEVLQQTLPAMQRVLGPEHELTLAAAASLARQLRQLGQLADAAAQLEQALEAAQPTLPAEASPTGEGEETQQQPPMQQCVDDPWDGTLLPMQQCEDSFWE